MQKLVINGPTPLKGEVNISGAKNSAVAILPATLLIDGICIINNLPNIVDVKLSCEILEGLGAKIKWLDKNSIEIDTRNINNTIAPIDLTRKFRASYYLIGSMLGRKKEIVQDYFSEDRELEEFLKERGKEKFIPQVTNLSGKAKFLHTSFHTEERIYIRSLVVVWAFAGICIANKLIKIIMKRFFFIVPYF